MAGAFGSRLRELRKEGQVLQSRFAKICGISSAYLSDIERGKRNPPEDRVILLWAEHLNPSQAKEIGEELLELAAADRGSLRAGVERDAVAVETDGGTTAYQGENTQKKAAFLEYFCTDLTVLAREGQLDEAPERVRDFEAIFQATARMRRNSVVLIHSNGREINRVLHGLVCELGSTPGPLSGKRVCGLGYGSPSILAGVKYRGQLEERVDNLIRESHQAGDVLLFVPSLADLADLEAHTKGSLVVPALQNGDIQVITGATPAAMSYCKQVCPDLIGCFRKVRVGALDPEGVLKGIFFLRDRYATYHGVTYADDSLKAMVEAVESGDESECWQRALNLMDDVGARAKVEEWTGEISAEDVARTVGELEEAG
ncbi:MAG: helix-turn-helix domain-containing protein [bacterium]|nr:helix-turn-helix domain-containing protein [bacterium]